MTTPDLRGLAARDASPPAPHGQEWQRIAQDTRALLDAALDELDRRKSKMDALLAELERPCCESCLTTLDYADVDVEDELPSPPYAERWDDAVVSMWHYCCATCDWEHSGDGDPPSIASRMRAAGRLPVRPVKTAVADLDREFFAGLRKAGDAWTPPQSVRDMQASSMTGDREGER